jgi:hypothetical protein
MRTAAEWLRNNIMQLSILTIYLLLVGATMHVHAMWRDEMQAWLIARDSPNLKDLLNNLRYEGHPALWYLLLMPLTRLSRNPALMQHLQLAISAASLSIVLWRAPLTRLERGLFPFGYFILYEYAVKSRSYALGILLLVVFCAKAPAKTRFNWVGPGLTRKCPSAPAGAFSQCGFCFSTRPNSGNRLDGGKGGG